MKKDHVVNSAASVRQRIINIAREKREDFQRLLTRYGLERFLYRLSKSAFSERFVLKGAMLYSVWDENPYRPTSDVDLLGIGEFTVENLIAAVREICLAEVEDDGLSFHIDSIRGEEIRDAQEYGGTRVKLKATLGTARIPIQIDVGLGDSVVPEATIREFPAILDLPSPRLLTYPQESVISEKFQAIVSLGMANSRMKDFFDIWFLSRRFDFNGIILSQAIQATFMVRDTPLPEEIPLGLSSEFGEDAHKGQQWFAFLNRTSLDADGLSLLEILTIIREFLMPPTEALIKGKQFNLLWRPPGPWGNEA